MSYSITVFGHIRTQSHDCKIPIISANLPSVKLAPNAHSSRHFDMVATPLGVPFVHNSPYKHEELIQIHVKINNKNSLKSDQINSNVMLYKLTIRKRICTMK